MTADRSGFCRSYNTKGGMIWYVGSVQLDLRRHARLRLLLLLLLASVEVHVLRAPNSQVECGQVARVIETLSAEAKAKFATSSQSSKSF
ncbi:hypothetical protein M426DRAFT_322661 [Hypoxylon sp. CI-4A]|nr:hypothetical protein M426DRAFT_322661 [Hypoxylon sp. CI-4A]